MDRDYKIWPQLLAGFAANLAMFNVGLSFSWPTIALPRLTKEESHIVVSSNQASWVVSALMLGACVGPIISGSLVNRIGRKNLLCMAAIPYVVSWILIFFASSFDWLFAARFISGLSIGASYSTVPIYLGEIAENRIRGALGTMSTLMVSCGSMISYCVGPWVSREVLAFIGMMTAMLFLLIFIWVPETPYYYLKVNMKDQAEKSLMWLRGTSNIAEELKEMHSLTENDRMYEGKITELITVPMNRRALFIMWILLSAQQFCGLVVIMAYLHSLLSDTFIFVDMNYAIMMVGAVSCVVNCFTTCVVDTLGRKPLMLVSTCGTAICLCMIATYFHMRESDMDVSSISWLPLFSVITFYTFFALGLGPVPYAVLSEIYPPSVKAWATMVVSVYGSILGVLVTKLFQMISDSWGHHVILFGFAAVEWMMALLMLFIVPETKGKSFREIQDMLSGQTYKPKG